MGKHKQKQTTEALYFHQKHATWITNFKDNSDFAKALLEQINAITVYEINIFQIFCLCPLVKMETRSIFKHIS